MVNPSSGSVDDALEASVRTGLTAGGLQIGGQSVLPDDALPEQPDLLAARADCVAVLAGDGTINAVASRLAGWDGAILALPGGTMNLLPRRLHGEQSEAQIAAAAALAPAIRLPVIEAGRHVAHIGAIAGPLAAWADPREAARDFSLARLRRAVARAWARSRAPGIRAIGLGREQRMKAVVVTPVAQGLEVAAISLDGLASLARIGVSWLGGDWRAAADIHSACARELTLVSPRAIQLLLDGEACDLASPISLRWGQSRVRFVATAPDPACLGEAGR